MGKLLENVATALAFFLGLAAVVYGISLWSVPSAWIVGGLGTAALAFLYSSEDGT